MKPGVVKTGRKIGRRGQVPSFFPKNPAGTEDRHTPPPRPEWMDDPALLPKKPPGRP